MGKREDLRRRVEPLIAAGRAADLEALLLAESGLPGPRGNLELSAAFAEAWAASGRPAKLARAIGAWAALDAQEAPTGTAREYLPFCAVEAMAATWPDERAATVAALWRAANDPRWRLREAAAIGLQRIGEADFAAMAHELERRLPLGSLLELRAIAAALAHPPILRSPKAAAFALELADRLLGRLRSVDPAGRKREDFKVLRQGLSYALSVFVDHLPEPGFERMRLWAADPDADIKSVVRTNLGKARLAKRHAREVAAVRTILEREAADGHSPGRAGAVRRRGSRP